MVLNYIWIAFILLAFLAGVLRLLCLGDLEIFPALVASTFDQARLGFEISLGLTGVLSLWLGVMKIGERAGVVAILARWLSPIFVRLFPDIPAGHPVTGSIFMNIAANMLGLDNAATPTGLKAMQGLQELNPKKDTASNSMIMFLVLNTSGLTLIPVSIMVYRAQMGAANPTDIFVPLLLTTFCSTLAGVLVTSIYQKINLLNRTMLLTLAGFIALLAGVITLALTAREALGIWSTVIANILLLSIIITFIIGGARARVNVYDAFIEGAIEGFGVAVKIIPYLIAILVAVGLLRVAFDTSTLVNSPFTLPADIPEWLKAIPTALMKPLSGSGARGLMVDCMSAYGADSFAGRLSCVFQGSTDTTFYILAVYFGSVGIRYTRHALTCGLLADAAGVLAAILICNIFF